MIRAALYVVFVFALFLLMLPLLVLISLAVAVSSGFPVFFSQRRIGKDGTSFTIYKFRTMVTHADQTKRQLLKRNESDGPAFKMRNDPRFTRIGKFLSHTGLDELPQLYNVIRGDMAFIGPRPLPVAEARNLKPWMNARHAILPGIISPAVLTGKYHKDFTWWMRSDVAYAREKSARGDAILFFRFLYFIAQLSWKEMIS